MPFHLFSLSVVVFLFCFYFVSLIFVFFMPFLVFLYIFIVCFVVFHVFFAVFSCCCLFFRYFQVFPAVFVSFSGVFFLYVSLSFFAFFNFGALGNTPAIPRSCGGVVRVGGTVLGMQMFVKLVCLA